MRDLRRDLEERGYELRETHISRVFLGPDRVWKVKRPVSLGFLDFSTLELRRRACEAEVELNRRLAPDVYLGVVPVRRGEDGRHRFGGDEGRRVDWAVEMRRLPDEARADTLLEGGELTEDHVDRLAARLVAFHEAAPVTEEITRFGDPELISRNLEENFEQTRDTIDAYLKKPQIEELVEGQRRFLEEHADAFRERMRAGRVRDGHGDLRLEHCYFVDGRVEIIDCIEFNDRFRFGDVAIDLAFLAMDLKWHGRVDLAERLLGRYALLANDYDLFPLIDFYAGYRAYVRAKIASMSALDRELDLEEREAARHDARPYYLLALACERRPLIEPRLVAVGGWIASGKTTVSEWLSRELSAPVVSSDRTRKHLLGETPETRNPDPAFSGAYTPDMSERVYAELLRRADAVLRSGRSVILDASFRSREERRRARELASSAGVPFQMVECRVELEKLRRRLRERETSGGVSDGRLEILDDFITRWEEIDELPEDEHLRLDTGRSEEEVLERLRAAIPTWPGELTA